MPRIKDVKPHIVSISKNIKKIEGIKSLYIWGSYALNANNLNFRIKDLDFLALTKFNSGDLISINDDIIDKICTNNYLEEQGYDPFSVKFSKKFTKFNQYNMDHWVISGDNKLLHWGPIFVNKKDAEEIKKEAERYASKKTGYNQSKINISSERIRKNWYNIYNNYVNNYLFDMPSGWYLTEETKMKNILKNALKI